MRKISTLLIPLAVGLFATLGEASTVRIYCSNAIGSVQVELTGTEQVRLYGGNVELEGATQLESEVTYLRDTCYQFGLSEASQIIATDGVPGQWSLTYYTVNFEMTKVCNRAETPAYRFNVDPRINKVSELLLCQEYRGI